MEKTVLFEPHEQVCSVTAVVTPNQGKAGKRTKKPPITQPRVMIAKTEPEMTTLTDTRIALGNYWEFAGLEGFKHLDHMWLRTVWWHRFKQK